MPYKKPSALMHAAIVFIITCCSIITLFAQGDPDPNSPAPVLLGVNGENKVMPLPKTRSLLKTNVDQIRQMAFEPGANIELFISSISLSKDEDFTAFRVHAQSSNGHLYRFPTTGLRPSDFNKEVYVLSVTLQDELGFWELPAMNADLSIQVTWRGMASNSIRLGYRKLGETINSLQSAYSKSALANSTGKDAVSPSTTGYKWSGDRMRFLEQATFGPTAALDARIRKIGLRTWLAEQFELPYPSAANPYPNQPLKPATALTDCDGDQTIPDVPTTCFRDSYTMYPLQSWFLRESLYGDAQLRHRVAWALSQIWVTSGNDIQQSRQMVEYYKILARNAFGNYRTLMEEMTLNPTMGDYLDMVRSTKGNPNENYPREIMQLFTVGLFMLNPDGTVQRDTSNIPVPTYDQNNVNNLTKVFTGWGFCQTAAACPNIQGGGAVNYIDPMLLNAGVGTVSQNRHDLTAKTLLSYPDSTTTDIAACSNCTTLANITTYANNSLDQALDNIYNHPNVAPFVSKRLIQHLVTSDPTPAYVARISAVFNANRTNPLQMKEVVKAILLDPEARGDVKTDPNYGKLREPLQYVTNVLRAFNVRSADGLSQSDGIFVGRGDFNGMSQIPFQSPTVFNYYPPDYVIPGGALLGPEFALMTTSTSIQRANFMNNMVFSRINTSVPNIPNGTSIDLSELVAASTADPTGIRLLDVINWKIMHGTMSASMRNAILPVITSVASSNPTSRAQQALYLVATSSQFQVQR